MKKILALALTALVAVSSTFALDMSIGLKGIVGGDNSSPKGTDLGGGIDINLNIWKGLGVQIESNIITSKITGTGSEGLTLQDNLNVNIPVIAWYNMDFTHFGFGTGLGVNCSLAGKHTEVQSSAFKMGLAAGANVRWHITPNVALVLGATGSLDCFPTLTKTQNGTSSTYKFIQSDYTRNSIYESLGVQYTLPLGKSQD